MKKLNRKRALERASSLLEECTKYSELRAFRGENITPEKKSRIGKEEVNGKVEEKVEDDKSSKAAQWMEKKSTLIYDMEEEVIDFENSKSTNWAGNKRIYLPKGGSTSLEPCLETRRAEKSKLYDKCLELLGGKDSQKEFDNMTSDEKAGLKSLEKRISSSELIVCKLQGTSRHSQQSIKWNLC